MSIEEFTELIEAEGQPAPGAAAVTAFETERGLSMPEDYRAFLVATPGGRVRNSVWFSLSGETDGQEIVGYVGGLGNGNCVSLKQ